MRHLLFLLLLGLTAGCLPALTDVTIDQDGDSVPFDLDCDDNDALNTRDKTTPGANVDADNDGATWCFDCDDEDADRFAGNEEVCDGVDNNCDEAVPATETEDVDEDQSVACLDCDDTDGTRTPGAAELCDGVDNDCDEAVPANEVDADTDGVLACAECDDNDADNFPGNPEVCDGRDNDCDDATVFTEEDVNADGDTAVACADCDDADPAMFPGNPEVCDGKDNDCDTLTTFTDDGGELIDSDSDTVIACLDCDDGDGANFPGNPEICDGEDNDCNGLDDMDNPGVGGQETDDDNDGQSECGGDCNDNEEDAYTGGTEECDQLDNDCDGTTDEGFDGDGDGALDDDACEDSGIPEAQLDCDDFDAAVFPGATELCNGEDDDCDETIDTALACEADALTAGFTCTFLDTFTVTNPPPDDFDEGSYLFCTTPATHGDAMTACGGLGYSLAVLDQMGDTGITGAGASGATEWWLSATDPQGTGTYDWTPGDPVGMGPWATGSPPNTPNQCMLLRTGLTTGPPFEEWDIQDCSTPTAFICEAVWPFE